jgi:hypothetical protein
MERRRAKRDSVFTLNSGPNLCAKLFGVESAQERATGKAQAKNDLSQRSSSNSQKCVTMGLDWRLSF